MKKIITIFTAVSILLAITVSLCLMTACGGEKETESSQTDDTSVFYYEKNDLSEYYRLGSLDVLTPEAILAHIERVRNEHAYTEEGKSVQLVAGCTVEADYVLYDGMQKKTLESGTLNYTLGEAERFDGLYSALLHSTVTIGGNRIIRTLEVPDVYEEDSVVLSLTVKKVLPALVTADEYKQPLEYYRNALLLEYNKTLNDGDKTIENGDTVVTEYKLTARAAKGKYKVGDTIDSGKDFKFTVGAGSTLADFDSAFVGHAAGDSFTNDMTLPENYGTEDMHGLDVTFECTVKSVTKGLNDNTAKAMGYQSAADFKDKTDAAARDRYVFSNAALSVLGENSELVSLPGSAVYTYRNESTYYQQYNLKYLAYYYSTDVDTVAKALYDFDTAQAYLADYFRTEDLQKKGEQAVESTLLLFCFIKAAGLDVSDDDFKANFADDTAKIEGYSDFDEYCTAAKAYYGVDKDRALALLKEDFYRMKAEKYFTDIING